MTQAFNLSQLANKVNTSGQLDISTGASGTLPIANGGTNNGSLAVTAGGVLYTDGSKIVNLGSGSTGQILKSNGSSAPAWGSSGGTLINIKYFTTVGSSTYTATTGTSFVIVEVLGGGGGGKNSSTAGGAGGTSSFGALCSATGGGGGTNSVSASGGSGSGGDFNSSGCDGGYGANNVVLAGTSSQFGKTYGGGGKSFATTGTGSSSSGGAGGYSMKKITSSFDGASVTIGNGGSGYQAGGTGLVIVYEYA